MICSIPLSLLKSQLYRDTFVGNFSKTPPQSHRFSSKSFCGFIIIFFL